jgi:hypothetical protein
MIGAMAVGIWKEPSRRRLYAFIYGPLVAVLILTQIAYPLLWER